MDKIQEKQKKGAQESGFKLKTTATALKDHPHDTVYINAATSHNTRLAYQSDIANFLKKGGGTSCHARMCRGVSQKMCTALQSAHPGTTHHGASAMA